MFGRRPYFREEAIRRCQAAAITVEELLSLWDLPPETRFSLGHGPLLEERAKIAVSRGFSVAGGANLDVVHAALLRTNTVKALETGVAAGWSTLALLTWITSQPQGRLVSVDRPYPGSRSNDYVGAVVPDGLATSGRWQLLNLPDRLGIPRALRALGEVDLVHYDSDKTPEGRRFAYPILYRALRPGGIFISDDVGDNMAFWEFVESNGLPALVVDVGDKFVGLIEKP